MIPDQEPAPLPKLNPLDLRKARSSIAALVAIVALFSPELAASLDAGKIIETAIDVVEAYDRVVLLGAGIWYALERANPRRALSFFAPLWQRRPAAA